MADDKWVYDFSEGSKDMRDLLGGKGANVAEMTRVLGADRVPAGFTITTEACVAYMKADQEEPDGMADQVADALERLQEHTGKHARRRRGPAARLRPLRRPRVDARDARHGPQPRPQRHLRRGPRARDRERPLRLGLLPALPPDVRQRLARDRRRGVREGDHRGQVRPRRRGRHRARHGRAQGARRPLQGAVQGRDRRGLPAGPAGAAAARDPRRVRLLDRRARHRVPAHQPHPRRVGHGGQRPADGVRQQGRHVRLRRRVQPRRGDRRARAERRLPPERPGRGRRLRRAHAARHLRDEGLAAGRATSS